MADQLPALPPGFKLDGGPTRQNAANLPPLPGGFTLDESPIANRKGSFLPISNDEKGNLQFDLSAGVTGAAWDALKRGSKAMEDVAEGRLDPTSPRAVRDTVEAAFMASPMSPAVRAAQTVVPGTLKALTRGTPKIPTEQELKAAGVAGFKQVREMGVDYSPDAVKSMADVTKAALENDGIIAELAPTTFSVLSKLDAPAAGEGERVLVNINGLIAARRSFQETAKKVDEKGNPTTDAAAASRAISALDDFIMAADPASVVAGPASAAGRTFAEARGNYAASKRAKDIEGREFKAELDAAAAGSGQNLDNRLRQVLKGIVLKRKEGRGYTQEELDLVEDIVRGKFGANQARYWGNFLGGGGGLGATSVTGVGGAAGAGIGALAAGPVGAAVGGAAGAVVPSVSGFALRRLAGGLTQARVRALQEATRKRSPLYQQAIEKPPTLTNLRPDVRTAVMRALLLSEPNAVRPQAPIATPEQAAEIVRRTGVY